MSESPASDTQRARANRRNSRKSTGPRTEDGKARSSRNALKHGLTSKDIVLPNENPQDFQDCLNDWLQYDRPQDPVQLAVIERAVAAKWKLDRCTRLETERLSRQVRHAVDQYDLDRLTEAEEIGRRLIDDPINRCDTPQVHDPDFRARVENRTADNPAVLTRQLQMTSQGVDWLIQRWVELGEMLKVNGFWHYPEKFRALWLLGRRPEDVIEDKLVQQIFLACNVAHPDVSDDDPDKLNLWDECYQAKMGLNGRPMYYLQVDNLRARRPADALTAQAQLWEVFTTEVTRLNFLKHHHLDPIDRLDRAAAESRAMVDVSPEGVLLRRYETACEREFHKAIADLTKLRKEAPAPPAGGDDETPIQNEPIAEVPVREEVGSVDRPRVRSRPASPRSSKGVDGPKAPREAVARPDSAIPGDV